MVTPKGTETVDLGHGVRRLADRYEIQGVQGPGERLWKGRIEVWLARDPAGTPLKILIERGWASVMLALKPTSAKDVPDAPVPGDPGDPMTARPSVAMEKLEPETNHESTPLQPPPFDA